MSYEYDEYVYEWDSEPSYSPSSTSDSAITTQQAIKQYTEIFAERMQEGNLDKIDKDHVAGMIYAILMKSELEQETLDRLVDARPGQSLFTDEEFEI